MKEKREAKRGFTLIELLIVVAIIAILAAIAIPNFLEAQTRAKCSRCKSDMRTLATAIEAYFVDWNSYTCTDAGDSWNVFSGWYRLTTPVAYTTSIPADPFGDARYPGGSLKRLDPMYELGSGAVGLGTTGTNFSNRRPSDTWEMSGAGPDHRDDTLDINNYGGGHQFAWNEVTYPWFSSNPAMADDPAACNEALTLVYDPTNGTVSYGNILRFGGQKPPGKVYDLLYSVASK